MTEHTTETKGALWAEAQRNVMVSSESYVVEAFWAFSMAQSVTDEVGVAGALRQAVFLEMLRHFLALVREE